MQSSGSCVSRGLSPPDCEINYLRCESTIIHTFLLLTASLNGNYQPFCSIIDIMGLTPWETSDSQLFTLITGANR